MTPTAAFPVASLLVREWPSFAGWLLAAVLSAAGFERVDAGSGLGRGAVLAALFVVVLLCAFRVVHHAEKLAHRFGEPYGTLILTLSVTAIEVSLIAAVMLGGEANPTLARDTMFAVVMIVLDGVVGFSLLMGGWKHREQSLNLAGSVSFLAVLVPLSVLTLVLPNFTLSTDTPTFTFGQAVYFMLVSIGLYSVFLSIQTMRHQDLFLDPLEPLAHGKAATGAAASPREPVALSVALLFTALLPVVFLSEKLGHFINHGIHTLGLPAALGGAAIAVLVLAPEGLASLRAARANRLQRSINISLGSALATIGLTAPAALAISLITGHPIVLGLDAEAIVLLFLSLFACLLTVVSGRTNILLGAVHVILFFTYIELIFDIAG